MKTRIKTLLLPNPQHEEQRLPATPGSTGRAFQSLLEKSADLQIVQEFRNKLRQTEDMISKLAFSLREIQDQRRKSRETTRQTPATIAAFIPAPAGSSGSR